MERRLSVSRHGLVIAAVLGVATAAPAFAQSASASAESAPSETSYEIGGKVYRSFAAYCASEEFREAGGRCGYRGLDPAAAASERGNVDCSAAATNPSPSYEPDGSTEYLIQVVVHILQSSDGTFGAIPDPLVHSQIQVLNEDFNAMDGTNGEMGHYGGVRFELATEDPGGSATTGITRSNNDEWYNDQGNYWDGLAWDPARYLNIYTNQASGNLGYVPYIPQGGPVGANQDRVVIHWQAFGSPGLGGPPYHLGRTVTHEVGHYLGLLHPFEQSCQSGTPPLCYTSGDLICDTPSLESPSGSDPTCTITQSCTSEDPVDNYMNYSDDACMTRFTIEQVRRSRCTLESYRDEVYQKEPVPTRSASWSSLKGGFR